MKVGFRRAVIVFILSAFVAAFVVCSFIFSFNYIGRPFPGFLVYPNLIVSPFSMSRWLPPTEGVSYPWVLDSIDSKPLRSSGDMEGALSSLKQGEIHLFTLIKGSERMVKGFPVAIFRLSDFLGTCGSLFLSVMIIVATGIVVGTIHAGITSLWLFFFCLCLAGWMGTLPDWMISHRIPWALSLFTSLTPAAFFGLALFYPSPLTPMRRHQMLIAAALIILVSPIFFLFIHNLHSPESYVKIDTLLAFLCVFSCFACIIRLAFSTSSKETRDREIARFAFIGLIISAGIGLIPLAVILYFFHTAYGLAANSVILVILPPCSLAWALWRARAL